MITQAYVNHGRWIADCPRQHCNNAEHVHPGAAFHCSNCQAIASVDWPDNRDDIESVLNRRPVPQTRNWFPQGHVLAVAFGVPHGETIADLLRENLQNEVL